MQTDPKSYKKNEKKKTNSIKKELYSRTFGYFHLYLIESDIKIRNIESGKEESNGRPTK